MKTKIKLLILCCVVTNLSFAQQKSSEEMSSNSTVTKVSAKVTKIVIEDETYYITTDIVGYPIHGEYLCEAKGDPIVQLNADGTGLIQMHGMNRTKMVWGIECQADGTAMKQDAPWGALYTMWYQIKEQHTGQWGPSGTIDSWDAISYSIHTDERKMYVLGERIKSY